MTSPLNQSKCKNFNKLQKIQQLLVSVVILIKKTYVNHGFIFPENLELSKKYINNQCAMQQYPSWFSFKIQKVETHSVISCKILHWNIGQN